MGRSSINKDYENNKGFNILQVSLETKCSRVDDCRVRIVEVHGRYLTLTESKKKKSHS